MNYFDSVRKDEKKFKKLLKIFNARKKSYKLFCKSLSYDEDVLVCESCGNWYLRSEKYSTLHYCSPDCFYFEADKKHKSYKETEDTYKSLNKDFI